MSTGTVTALERTTARGRARHVVVDGSRWRTTSVDVVRALEIVPDTAYDLDMLSEAIDEAEPRQARMRALLLLGARERGSAELRDRLALEGYARDVAAEVVAGLEASGLVDDARFAAALARTMTSVSGYGRARIARQLSAKGVPQDVAESALDECCPADAEAERLRELAEKLAPRCGGDRLRLARRLVSRGFRPSDAVDAAEHACRAPEEE